MPLSVRIFLAVTACCAALAGACVPPPLASPAHGGGGELVVTVLGEEGRDSVRAPVPRPGRRPALPRQALPYAGGHGTRVEALSPADTGVIVLLLTENPSSAGPAVQISELRAGRPAGEEPKPRHGGADAPASGPCISLTAFLLSGLGRVPSGPVVAHFSAGERHAAVRVDPRHHTLRLAPVLRFSTDTLPGYVPEARRSVTFRFASRDTARLIAVGRSRAGRYTVLTAGGTAGSVTLLSEREPLQWAVYLMDDRARHHSPCRGAPPPPPARAVPADRTPSYVAREIDSVLAAYGVPPLRETRMRRGERELRFTAGGGMAYYPDYVMRIVERRGRVRGELYETWRRVPGKPYAGGPFGLEKQPPERVGCLSPQVAPDRWVCRIDRMIPVDWAVVLARLDSLGAGELPAQVPTTRYVTDQGHVIVEARSRRGYNAAYHYGARGRRDSTEARVEAVGGVFASVLAGRMAARPDSVLKVQDIAAGHLSIASGVVMVVRDERTWNGIWRAYPSSARLAGLPRPLPKIDFDRQALLLVGQGKYPECAPIPDNVRRVDVRGDTVFAVIGEVRRKGWWLECDPDPAPVQALVFNASPRTPVMVVHDEGRYWPPHQPPGSPVP